MSYIKAEIKATVYLELTIEEAMCLDAICGYGCKQFLEVFKEHMGKYYIEPYDRSIESLFNKCRDLKPFVEKVVVARKELSTKITTNSHE